jgi:hypothetical protein
MSAPIQYPGSDINGWDSPAWQRIYTGVSEHTYAPPPPQPQPDPGVPSYLTLIAEATAAGQSANPGDLIGYFPNQPSQQQ